MTGVSSAPLFVKSLLIDDLSLVISHFSGALSAYLRTEYQNEK